MDLQTVTGYLTQYGAIAVFVIVFLEYLGLPGFPAGIIMPAAGIVAARGGIGFIFTLFLSVVAGLISSIILYFIGRFGGDVVLAWVERKFPKQAPTLDKAITYIKEKGVVGIFISRLIPAVRTMTSIPAGVVKMNFMAYSVWTVFGITLWNVTLIGAGYFLGDAVFSLFV